MDVGTHHLNHRPLDLHHRLKPIRQAIFHRIAQRALRDNRITAQDGQVSIHRNIRIVRIGNERSRLIVFLQCHNVRLRLIQLIQYTIAILVHSPHVDGHDFERADGRGRARNKTRQIRKAQPHTRQRGKNHQVVAQGTQQRHRNTSHRQQC